MSLVGRVGRSVMAALGMSMVPSTKREALPLLETGSRFGEKANPYMRKFGRRPFGRGCNPLETNGVRQGKKECQRRMKQVIRGTLDVFGYSDFSDRLAVRQQMVRNFTIEPMRKAA